MIFFSIVGVGVFILLFFVSAPYGQHIRQGWGPNLNNKLGWFIMEIPTVVIYLIIYFLGERKTDFISIVFLLIWMAHYGQRTFIFPFLIRAKKFSSLPYKVQTKANKTVKNIPYNSEVKTFLIFSAVY